MSHWMRIYIASYVKNYGKWRHLVFSAVRTVGRCCSAAAAAAATCDGIVRSVDTDSCSFLHRRCNVELCRLEHLIKRLSLRQMAQRGEKKRKEKKDCHQRFTCSHLTECRGRVEGGEKMNSGPLCEGADAGSSARLSACARRLFRLWADVKAFNMFSSVFANNYNSSCVTPLSGCSGAYK